MSPSGSFVNKKMFENKCQHLEINWQSLNNIRRVLQGLDQIITVDGQAFGKYHIVCHIKVSCQTLVS
jgi:hypothetical protein